MKHIVRTKDTCHGQPRIDGTRIPTWVIGNCASFWTVDEIMEQYPLTREQVEAALRYERLPWRRLRRWLPSFEGTVTWRGREWEI